MILEPMTFWQTVLAVLVALAIARAAKLIGKGLLLILSDNYPPRPRHWRNFRRDLKRGGSPLV